MPELVLASSSPRRQEMLKEIGVEFVVDSSDVDETPLQNETLKDYVQRIAKLKAETVAKRHEGKVVLAADTAATLGRKILGKPTDKAHAHEMISSMSGGKHHVLTSICAIDADGNAHEDMTDTEVHLREMSMQDVERFVSIEDNWLGKAGGYGLQTPAGASLVKAVIGSHTGVIGLPLVETIELLKGCGFADL